jgi:hypothetical protein
MRTRCRSAVLIRCTGRRQNPGTVFALVHTATIGVEGNTNYLAMRACTSYIHLGSIDCRSVVGGWDDGGEGVHEEAHKSENENESVHSAGKRRSAFVEM